MIYPNPSSDIFNLLLTLHNNKSDEKITIKVLDIMGRELINKNMSITGTILSTSIDLTDISEGIYMIQVISEEKYYNQKIIKN